MQEKKPRTDHSPKPQSKPNKILKNRKGFIIIIGLSIVALTMYYSIMVQKQMIRTVQETKRSNDLFQAKLAAQSIGDFVSYVINKHDAGFSLDATECKYVKGQLSTSSMSPLCSGYFQEVATIQAAKGNDMTIRINVKGKLNSDNANSRYATCVGSNSMASTCYGVPAPATGDAGNDTICQAYKESIAKDTTKSVSDIDNPCNWNKLTFGSNLTDRVAIPLYYDKSIFPAIKISELQDLTTSVADISNPFGGVNASKNFILRIRTPCLPCYNKDPKTGQEITTEAGKRSCEGTSTSTNVPKSPYYCSDDERYVLDTTKDDMVASWQITGLCGADECGMIQFKEVKSNGDPTLRQSAIKESLINDSDAKHNIINTTITTTEQKPRAKDTTTYNTKGILILDKLKDMTKPVFSMFLSGKLIGTVQGQFVPYLEYQFLSDTPVGQAKIESEIQVIINNVVYTQKLEKAERRPLVDFAIQN